MYFGHIYFQLLPVSPPRLIPKPSTLHLLLTYSSLCPVCVAHVLIYRLDVDPSIRVLLTFHGDQLKENRFQPPRSQNLSVVSLLMFSFPLHPKIQLLQRLLFWGIAFSLELQVKTRNLGNCNILHHYTVRRIKSPLPHCMTVLLPLEACCRFSLPHRTKSVSFPHNYTCCHF